LQMGKDEEDSADLAQFTSHRPGCTPDSTTDFAENDGQSYSRA